jgi:hypothetical protein
MNWLNSLRRKAPAPSKGSATKATKPEKTVAPKPAPVNIAALRQALAALPESGPEGRVPQHAEQTAAQHAAQLAELGEALAAAVQPPLADDAPETWCTAVGQCPDKARAIEWLEKISDETLLADIAASARFAEVRLAAAQRVTRSNLLESLARGSKNKDKGVYRHCADLLRERREAQEREHRAGAIAAALAALLDRAPVSVSHLLEIEREWKALLAGPTTAPVAEPPAYTQCRDLLAQANARILAETEAQRALQGLQNACRELAAHVAAEPLPAPGQLAAFRDRHRDIALAWSTVPPWLSGTTGAAAIPASLATIDSRLQAIETDIARVAHAEAFLAAVGLPPGTADATAATEPPADAPHDRPIDAATEAAWAALPQPENRPAREQLAARWQALKAALAPEPAMSMAAVAASPQEPPPAPMPPAPLDLDALRTQLDLLEQALEAGQLAQGDLAARNIKTVLDVHKLEARLDARLQRALGRLGELRGWAQWGANKKREDLIAAAAQLRSAVAQGTHDIEHLAVAIPALREQWKALNAQGPAAKGQWESFDRALAAAYVPLAAHYAEETERRNQAKAVREALLAGWESRISAIDWQNPDPAAIDALRDQMLGQWRAAPHAGYRDERALRAKFDALVRGLDQHVDAARAAEIQRREDLIAAAVALASEGDPRLAAARAKELQELWRDQASALRLRRGEEQKLWQRFRAACDAIFARRDAERAAQSAHRQERLQARGQLLENFAAVLSGSGDADAIRRALGQFRLDWDAAGAADAGEAAPVHANHDRQARELQRQAQQRIGALRLAAVEARYAAMAQATAASDGLAPQVLEQGRAAREDLLIDLEIALGLATPGAAAELRRRRQLEQLQNRFRAGKTPAGREHDPEKLLAQWYAIPAPADASHALRAASVVRALTERARAELEKTASEPARPARAARPQPPRAAPRPSR